MEPVRIIVYGRPAPEGNKQAMPVYYTDKETGKRVFSGHANVVESKTTRATEWRRDLYVQAHDAIKCECPDPDCIALLEGYPIDEPVKCSMVFAFARPKGHYGKRGNLVSAGLAFPRPTLSNIGDLEKLARAVEDGLQSAGVLANDNLIVEFTRLAKCWTDDPRCPLDREGVVVWLLPDTPTSTPTRPATQPRDGQLSLNLEDL